MREETGRREGQERSLNVLQDKASFAKFHLGDGGWAESEPTLNCRVGHRGVSNPLFLLKGDVCVSRPDASTPRILPRVLPTVSASMDRGTFLRTAGSAALFAALGITLPGCGGGDPTSPGATTPPVSPPPPDSGGATPGLSLSGNVLTINLAEGSFSGLRAAGGWLALVRQVGGRQVNLLAVNVDGSTIRAFSSVCPHAGCNNNWQYANDRFRCTCHDSIFENSGRRVSGPATRDLTEFSASRSGDSLAVTLAS